MKMTRSIHAQHILDTASIETRSYQIRTIDKVLSYHAEGIPSVLIESATGSGKTVMGLIIAKALNEKGLSVGWCAMRKNLLTQTNEANQEKNINANITTFSMFDKNPPKVDVIIVDEAHHDACASMATIHGIIKPKFIIGLSATPQRHDKVGLVFSKTVKEAGLYDLVREKFLAKADLYMIQKWTPQEVTRTYLERPKHYGKSIMFFKTEALCVEAAEILKSQGVSTAVVTGHSDKLQQIDDFESGVYDVLVSINVLTEGFDCPSLESVFVRPSVKGLTMQMCGRVLRKFPKIKKKIIQSVDTANPFNAIAPVGKQYIHENGAWTTLGTENKIQDEIKRIKELMLKNYSASHQQTISNLKAGKAILINDFLKKPGLSMRRKNIAGQ